MNDGVLLRLELRIEVCCARHGILIRLPTDVPGTKERLLPLRCGARILQGVLRTDDAGSLRFQAVALTIAPGFHTLQRCLEIAVIKTHDQVARANALALAVRQFHNARRHFR